jgi:hypothetical protein
MIETFVHGLVLKVKAATGADEEVFIWTIVGAVLSLFALIFFSLAAFIWLADLYGGATAALTVGGIYLLIVAILAARCAAVRATNRRIAREQLELAARQPALDPRYLAIGLEVVKTIGLRNILPFVAAGLVAAGLGFARNKNAAPPQ